MLPFLEVNHLPSSSSFYSAITQPLGLRYLSTEAGPSPSITFGTPFPPTPVFQIRLGSPGSEQSLKLSRIVISAPSPTAVSDFYESALQAYPGLDKSANPSSRCFLRHPSSDPSSRGEIQARITDFDGNTMSAIYDPHSPYEGTTKVRYSATTPEQARGILNWDEDVGRSTAPSGYFSGGPVSPAAPYHHDIDDYDSIDLRSEPPRLLRRSTTTTRTVYETPSESPRQSTNGVSTGAVVGALLGVAAGAAISYSYGRSRDRNNAAAARQEYGEAPPTFSRRTTFSDRDPYSETKDRFVEVERTTEKIRYPKPYSDYPSPMGYPAGYGPPPPEYAARYSKVSESPAMPRMTIRGTDDDNITVHEEDTRSRYSTRSRPASTRSRSEAGSTRRPLLITDHSHVSVRDLDRERERDRERDRESRHESSASSRYPPRTQRQRECYTYDTPEATGSYVSARSHRSSSTVRVGGGTSGGAGAGAGATHLVSQSQSRVGGRVATTTVRVGQAINAAAAANMMPPPLSRDRDRSRDQDRDRDRDSGRGRSRSRVNSHVSARYVPLPHSGVGSSRADYEENNYYYEDDGIDDAGSIVPEDSISCVGSRRSGWH